MKIIHFDEMFHPDFGYQINVLPKYQVKQGHEVIVVTGDNINRHPMFVGFGNMSDLKEKDKDYEMVTGVKIVRLPTKGIISGRVIFKEGFVEYIEGLKPDILFCHFNDTVAGIEFVKYSRKSKFPIVFDNHMLEMASRNPLRNVFRWYYRKFLTPIISKNKLVVIRTQDDPYVNKCLGIPEAQTPFISFGTDTSLFHPDGGVRKAFRNKYDIKNDDFVVVYTGKISEEKGGKLLAQAFEKKYDCNKNIVHVVVGNTSGPYGEEVEQIFGRSENRIIRIPTQRYVNLAQFYQAADLSVFPKQCSLSFYDAQACGLPVVSENNNINVDRLQHNNGFNFKAGDIKDFREKIIRCAEMNAEEYRKMGNNAFEFVNENYNYKDIALKYTEILMQEYQKHLMKLVN